VDGLGLPSDSKSGDNRIVFCAAMGMSVFYFVALTRERSAVAGHYHMFQQKFALPSKAGIGRRIGHCVISIISIGIKLERHAREVF
jgi:hypothetical protein